MKFDKIIIGAGLYGLYSALVSAAAEKKFWCWNVIQRRFVAQLT